MMTPNTCTEIIYIFGSRGVGKSTAACLLSRSLIDVDSNGYSGNWVCIEKDPTVDMLQKNLSEATRDPSGSRRVCMEQFLWNVAGQISLGNNAVLSSSLEGFWGPEAPIKSHMEKLFAAAADSGTTRKPVRISYIGLTISDEERKKRMSLRNNVDDQVILADWQSYIDKVHEYDRMMEYASTKIDITDMDSETIVRKIWQASREHGEILEERDWAQLPPYLQVQLKRPSQQIIVKL